MATGQHCDWMADGFGKPALTMAPWMAALNGASLKLWIGSGGLAPVMVMSRSFRYSAGVFFTKGAAAPPPSASESSSSALASEAAAACASRRGDLRVLASSEFFFAFLSCSGGGGAA